MRKIFKVALFIMLISSFSFSKEVILKDVLDREVKLNLPVKRIALGFYYTDFLAVGGVKALDKVVGFSKAVWTDWTPASWELYSKTLPKLNSIADFGEVEVGTFSVEKVLSLKPDLLILAAWQYQVLEFDLEPIIEANIPIIVLDYNKEKVELHAKSTELLGVITGEEKRAKELVDFYKNTANEVASRIEKAQLPKPKIYIEFGNKGPNETGFTYGKDMWGALIDLAGGENIAAPFVKQWAPINPEQVLISKPDVIMIAGRETELKKNQEAMVMGFNIDEKEALKRLEAYKNRPGWSALPAIKDNRLYGLYMGASRTLADAAMIQYIAKALYPSLFEDIDPIQTYINFHKNYLPVIPEGTFGIQAK
ncbi:ABC transporter substrate-binding protein [Campylobacter vulpis]|uniref:ABC transporter substrate-binding protein n=2 Tax=Campylobacter vulpis TaxID=1655500 RepID=UPI000C1606B0|nr:ABC transporter substrate-binding protein [Campylobacter vulpis]MBS4307522.1 ABC transporter substrate-binding protein [Campylobacter vulpis]MBS4330347.1 ABC transporter substrate-binding protein [Campylobacter vulpis]MBS4423979.1 ABC transporter substrate-binding protein [Campylobacter vulpis]PHY89446.1 iron ABC transporter substrate-binding protein [Campylobacter vulpis]QNF77275.1 iron ABC transporter, periplasmic iron-binding protein [Campylobacter vulpis]